MPHKRAKFCPLCGAGLAKARIEGRHRPRCAECGFVYFFNPASASAAVVLNQDGQVLLVLRGIEPFKNHWALPAGYQELDEDPRDAATREVFEETGIEAQITKLLDVIWMGDDPRKPANVLVYLGRATGGSLKPGSDAADTGWFDLADLPEPIGFDNQRQVLARLASVEKHTPDSS